MLGSLYHRHNVIGACPSLTTYLAAISGGTVNEAVVGEMNTDPYYAVLVIMGLSR